MDMKQKEDHTIQQWYGLIEDVFRKAFIDRYLMDRMTAQKMQYLYLFQDGLLTYVYNEATHSADFAYEPEHVANVLEFQFLSDEDLKKYTPEYVVAQGMVSRNLTEAQMSALMTQRVKRAREEQDEAEMDMVD